MNCLAFRNWFKNQQRWLDYVLKLILLLLLVILLVEKVDFSQVWVILTKINFYYLVSTLALYIVARYFLALQMSIAFRSLNQNIAVGKLLKIQLIMSFYSIVLPGELMAGGIGWYKLTQLNEKAVESAALIIYVRFVNILALLILGLVGISFDTQPAIVSVRFLVFTLLISLLVAMLPFFSTKVNAWFQRTLLSLADKVKEFEIVSRKMIHFLQTIDILGHIPPIILLRLIVISIFVEMLHTIIYYLIALAVGIHLPLLVIAWIRTAITLLQILPVSFAGLGVREVSLIWFLQHYSVPNAQALSFSLVIFAYLVVTGMLGGLVEAYDILFSFRSNPKD